MLVQDRSHLPHGLASAGILDRWLRRTALPRFRRGQLTAIVAGHHGTYPEGLRAFDQDPGLRGEGLWVEVQDLLLDRALSRAGIDADWVGWATMAWTPALGSLVNAIVVMADWIASGDDLPRLPRDLVPDLPVGDIPTQGFALVRLALAVLHRALDGPPTAEIWYDLWASGEIPMDLIERYLDAYRDRFWLIHPTAPFLQVPGLRTAKDEISGLEKLVADVPTGHQFFTTRIGRGLDRLTFAEAARWLVHLQAFDVSGIKSGAVGDPRVNNGKGFPIGQGFAGYLGGLVVEGPTLWRTLLLNLIPRDQSSLVEHGANDRPAWERPVPGPAPAEGVDARPTGPASLFTWSSRRVRLVADDEGVTGCVVTNGDRLLPQNMQHLEPMTAWRRSNPQEKALKLPLVYMPRTHDPARALWRGLASLLPAQLDADGGSGPAEALTAGVVGWSGEMLREDPSAQVGIHAIGMVYGTQNAVVEDIVDDRLVVHAALVSPDHVDLQRMVVTTVDATERGVRAVRDLAANLTQAAGGTDPRLVDGSRDRAAEQCYAALDGPFRRWLSALGPGSDRDTEQLRWQATARDVLLAVAKDLIESTGPDAWVGREVRGRRVSSPEAYGWFLSTLSKVLPHVRPAQEVSA